MTSSSRSLNVSETQQLFSPEDETNRLFDSSARTAQTLLWTQPII
jgi:hypothetical protein